MAGALALVVPRRPRHAAPYASIGKAGHTYTRCELSAHVQRGDGGPAADGVVFRRGSRRQLHNRNRSRYV